MNNRLFWETIKNLLTIALISDTAYGKRTLQTEAYYQRMIEACRGLRFSFARV